MKRNDFISGIFWFFGGLSIVLYAPRFDLGTASEPGSGLMPFLSGILMCIFSGITFLRAYLEKGEKKERIWGDFQLRKNIFVVVCLLLFAIFLELIGFFICTFFLILILIRSSGRHSWLPSLLGAGITVSLSYLLFEVWLRSHLPKGIFGF